MDKQWSKFTGFEVDFYDARYSSNVDSPRAAHNFATGVVYYGAIRWASFSYLLFFDPDLREPA